jgi:hypothetical protein
MHIGREQLSLASLIGITLHASATEFPSTPVASQ